MVSPAQKQLWTIKSALEWTCGYLDRHGDEHPRLSAEWLLCDATGFSRVEVYMNYDRPLNKDELAKLHVGVERRGKGEPLQYITGEMPFRHLILKCAPGVLIPRPETEILVDQVLNYLDTLPEDVQTPRVLEIGTGTGCIACSIASEREGVQVVATDISPKAYALAERNRNVLNLQDRVTLHQCNLADDVEDAGSGVYDVLVSNPPYIPSGLLKKLPHEVSDFEPELALDGGEDGLDVFRKIVDIAVTALKPGGLLACELHEDCLEAAAAEELVVQYFDHIEIVQDLTHRNRILCACRKEA